MSVKREKKDMHILNFKNEHGRKKGIRLISRLFIMRDLFSMYLVFLTCEDCVIADVPKQREEHRQSHQTTPTALVTEACGLCTAADCFCILSGTT